MVAYVNGDYVTHFMVVYSKHEEIRLPHEIVFVVILYFIGAILSKKNVKVRGSKKFEKRDLLEKGAFLKKGG